MQALIDYIQAKAFAGRSRFSGRVVLAGGSAGAPVPAMITGFYPEKVSGLMIIFGFTNIKAVINNEIYRQGLIRLKITDSEEGLQFSIQRGFLKFLGTVFSVILGNMLKYGDIELYLSGIKILPYTLSMEITIISSAMKLTFPCGRLPRNQKVKPGFRVGI